MKLRTAAVAMLVAGVLFSGAVNAEDNTTTEQKIASLEAALGEAMVHRDIATLDRLVADEWTIQNDSSALGNKAGFIGDVRSGALSVKSFKLHDVHVRVLGDVALVQGFDDEESSYKGHTNSGTYNWLDVWQRRNGQWVSLVTQLTKVQTK